MLAISTLSKFVDSYCLIFEHIIKASVSTYKQQVMLFTSMRNIITSQFVPALLQWPLGIMSFVLVSLFPGCTFD